ncbi:MAG: TonB-dependent receptor [Bacteroidia bacterium]|nr:TonB-dependent receptor [Bacteroidia bacterium]
MKQKNLIFLPKGNWTRMLLSLVLLMVLMTGMAFAQQKTLTGKVTDESGASIPGVSVLVKGTTTGTVTDIDGKYSLNVPSKAETLSFGFVGMISQDLLIGDKTVINVTLKLEVVGVDEVVVVGYGTRKKEELTGSISTVSDKQLKTSTAPSVVSRMQGQVSGINVTSSNVPGGEATIRIHGIGTVNNPNPLYVIDGVPVGPGNNVNPNDVESISVLKDASSAAIYGSRGANGVILITTKHGRENQEPNITLSIRTGFSQASNQYNMLNTAEYGQAVWLQAKNLGNAPNSQQYGKATSPVIPDYVLPAATMEGDPSAAAAKYNYPDYQIFKANKQGTNWYDEIYRTGLVQEYDLSVSGGGKKSTYSISGNYLDEQGFLIYTGFKRYNFRVNADTKFGNWLKVGQSIQAIYINQKGDFGNNGEGNAISMAYRMQPIVPVYDIKGNFAGTRAPGTGNAANPVAQLSHAQNNDGKWFRVLGNIYGEATIMKGLTFKSLFGYNVGQWNAKTYNLPTYENAEPNKVAGLTVDSNYSILWNWANTINYNLTIKDIHKINVVIGAEAVESNYQWLSAGRSQYFSLSPDYMQLGSGELNKDNNGNGSSWALFSQFGRANYDLMGKYYLEATARRDGSSRFGAANRYGIFPAASGAWEISKEGFMASTKSWLDMLKLRAGWGKSGNDQIGEYNMFSTFGTNGYTAAYNLNGTTGSAIAGFEPSTKGNPDVSWETTETLNMGVNASMLNKKLTLAVDVWQRNTSDMLYRLSVPQVMGLAQPPYVNIGKMKNTGIDIELGYHNTLMAGKFTYAINATWSHYKNEVVSLSNNLKEVVGFSTRQVEYTRATTGQAYPMFYGLIVDGIIKTTAEASAAPKFDTYSTVGHFKYKDLNGDGLITMDKDRTFIGDPHPKFTGGLNIDLGYANFDLNMFFYGSYGNDLINYVSRWIDYGQFVGGLSADALYSSWTPTNTGARLPMLDGAAHSQEASTAFIEDGSYLRMKTMRLGYTIPQSVLDKVKIKSLRLYLQATNLFTITKYKGLDPELDSSGMTMGFDQGSWPTARQITFGLTLGL